MQHDYGPRRTRCRTALLVAGGGGVSPMTALMQAALADFGTDVTLLEQPTLQQLEQGLKSLQTFAGEHSWVEVAYLYFTGRGVQSVPDDSTGKTLQLLEVQQDGVDPAAAAAAAGAAAAADVDMEPSAVVLAAPLEELESAAQRDQLPLLIQIDTVPSSCQPTEQQLAAFSDTLQDRCSFSHRVTAMDCADDDAVLLWTWLMIKHTFFVWHNTWAAAHAAAAAELAAEGVAGVLPRFASDPASNTALFPHGPVPEQHHRVLKLLHDITTAAHTSPRANSTLSLLQQLSLLLDDEGGWRQFVLRWGLLQLTTTPTSAADADAAGAAGGVKTDGGVKTGGAGGSKSAGLAAAPAGADVDGAAAAAAPAAGSTSEPLDELMKGIAALLLHEMKLPGAVLALAAAGRADTAQAAADVLRHLAPLTDYGVLPGEQPGQPDAELRAELGKRLLEVQVALHDGNFTRSSTSPARPLCLLPFVSGFLSCQGLEAELKAATEDYDPVPVYDPIMAAAALLAAAEDWNTSADDQHNTLSGLLPAAKRLRAAGDSSSDIFSSLHQQHLLQNRLQRGLADSVGGGAAAPIGSSMLPPLPPAAGFAGGVGGSRGLLGGGPASLLFSAAAATNPFMRAAEGAGGLFRGLLGNSSNSSAAAAAAGAAGGAGHSAMDIDGGAGAGAASAQQVVVRPGTTIGLGITAPLPPGVQELTVSDIFDAAPLLHLQSLSKLTLNACSGRTAALMQLTALQSLRHLELHHNMPAEAAAAAGAWPLLPVCSLSLSTRAKNKWAQYNTIAVLAGLGQISPHLTSLHLSCKMPKLAPASLGNTLSRLTSLAKLSISMLNLDNRQAHEGWQKLMRSIASLPQLQSLNISGMSYYWSSPNCVQELAAISSTVFTKLVLSGCGVDDTNAICIIRGPNLKGLRELDLSSFSFDGAAVSDATMAAIATNLTALSRLHLPRGSVTAAGKRQVLAVLPGVAIDC